MYDRAFQGLQESLSKLKMGTGNNREIQEWRQGSEITYYAGDFKHEMYVTDDPTTWYGTGMEVDTTDPLNYCNDKTGMFPDPEDSTCTKYFNCAGVAAESKHESCFGNMLGTMFNSDENKCDWQRNVEATTWYKNTCAATPAPTTQKATTTPFDISDINMDLESISIVTV